MCLTEAHSHFPLLAFKNDKKMQTAVVLDNQRIWNTTFGSMINQSFFYMNRLTTKLMRT